MKGKSKESLSRGDGKDGLEQEGVEPLVPGRLGFKSGQTHDESMPGKGFNGEIGFIDSGDFYPVDRAQGKADGQSLPSSREGKGEINKGRREERKGRKGREGKGKKRERKRKRRPLRNALWRCLHVGVNLDRTTVYN